MNPTDPLSEQISLFRIRRKAARRNEIFFAALFIVVLIVGALYFRLNYQIEWLVLIFPMIAALVAGLSLLQVTKQSELSSIIELIEAIRNTDQAG